MARVCASCGKKLGFFTQKRKCVCCGEWLCGDCEYMAVQSGRCPACGKHDPFKTR